jgi:poly(hydroxyalkanoate) depolymerase family esterase
MRYLKILPVMTMVFIGTVFGQNGSITIYGKSRTYTVHAATGLTGNPPLILALHALGETAAQFRSLSGWDAKADKEKFVVVYPVGITPTKMNGMNLIGWDIVSDTDVVFITTLIDTMASRYKIDRKRVYATGFSMGGMMSYTLACQASDKITAIGPDAGYPVGQNASSCKPSSQVAVCHIHGADDDFVKYSGVADWVKLFANLDKCQQSPKTTNPSSKAKKDDWSPCENGNEVILYSIAGMAHDYATSSQFGFSATDTLWAFFSRHSGPTGVSNRVFNTPSGQSISADYSAGKIQLKGDRNISLVRVFDVQGKAIFLWKTAPGMVYDVPFPVNHMGGIYLLNIMSGSGASTLKIVVP